MEQSDLLRTAVALLSRPEIPYVIVGSLASGTWGESRFTQDVDIVVDIDERRIGELCEAFPATEFYVSKEAALDALALGRQFNVIHPASGSKIDFMIAGRTAWSQSQLERRQAVNLFEDLVGYVAAPEDVILSKLL